MKLAGHTVTEQCSCGKKVTGIIRKGQVGFQCHCGKVWHYSVRGGHDLPKRFTTDSLKNLLDNNPQLSIKA